VDDVSVRPRDPQAEKGIAAHIRFDAPPPGDAEQVFSHNARANSVLTKPGAMQLTRTLDRPHSTARLRASWMPAALESA